DRSRGGLRARRGAHPVRRRGRRGPAGERHAVRPLGLDLDAGRRSRAPRGARDRHRRPVRQLELVGPPLDALRRLQAVGLRARARDARARGLLRGQERVHRDVMGRLDGKVAVITGAGGGMGREAAILFTQEGAKVCAADVQLGAAEETAALCAPDTAFAFEVDVANEQQVSAMMSTTAERFGGIDVLYNNAGISPDDDASVVDTSVDAWDRVQDVNTKGVFLCCKHGIPYLLERGGGSVINVASFVAILGAATSQISYTASKGAVLAMSKELGVQFAREGVRVNALCPGPVETPLLLAIFGDDPAAFARRQVHWPTGRLGKPREIVNAALFLASDESSFVNGAAFVVDGGITAAYVTPESP